MDRVPVSRSWIGACLGLLLFACDDDSGRGLPLSGVTRVEVSRFYCGGLPWSCGLPADATIDYEVDLTSATLTVTRCTPTDADRVERPQMTRSLTADQLKQVRDALAEIRVVEAKIALQDGQMLALTLTHADGMTSRYSPEAACGGPTYQKVVEGFPELWRLISDFDSD